MATKETAYRYAPRNVYGSEARELESEQNYYTQQEAVGYGGAVAIPMPRPEYIPDTKPEVIPEARPEVKTRTQARPRIQKRYGVSLFGICGFVVVAVLMMFVILAQVGLTEVSAQTSNLQRQLDTLNEQERKLQISYASAFDMNEIEDYAVSVLGMSKPTQNQINVIDTTPSDVAQIVPVSDNPGNGGTGGFISFLVSLLAYFK